MQKSHVSLTPAQAAHLTDMTTRGTVRVRAPRRATALLALHAGQSYWAVARPLGVKYSPVSGWAPRLATARPAVACSKAPEGHSPWSLRLLAGNAVELSYCRQLWAA